MAVAITDLREQTDDHDPGSANLSLKGGKAKMSYWWTSTNVEDFTALAQLLLGSALTDLASANPGIKRTMPACHPRFPSLYAESISDFAGLGGKFQKEASADPFGVGKTQFPEYTRYPEYRLEVEFANRLYTVLTDAERGAATALDWSDDTGTGASVAKKCWDTLEYNRWTWVTGGPKENLLTAKQGQMVLDVGNPAVAKVFPDMPKMPLPDGAVVIKWFEVPYSFVRPSAAVDPTGASWFQLYQGRVNQFEFLNWQPGELLYVTISPKPFTTPFPDPNGNLVTLCDIDIICLETKRLLASGDIAPSPSLDNWIAAGFNLQPWWYDRQFHYAHVGNLASAPAGQTVPADKQVPSWKSFPFQILFSSPEVALPP